MPVNLLLCEGESDSPDVRVLTRVLMGLCEVRPLGGKYGMGEKILARRETLRSECVFGLLDGDFREWKRPEGRPVEWHVRPQNKEVHLGWRWERKEIENYLIDPAVVSRALGGVPAGYEDALGESAEELAIYQSARIALTLSRPRLRPMACSFGKRVGRDQHLLPDDLSREACIKQMHALAEKWNLDKAIDPSTLSASYGQAEAECNVGGARRKHFLTAFAGKDLLWAMNAHLKTLGFDSSAVFCEKILTKLTEADDVAEWLPEWQELRRIVANQA